MLTELERHLDLAAINDGYLYWPQRELDTPVEFNGSGLRDKCCHQLGSRRRLGIRLGLPCPIGGTGLVTFARYCRQGGFEAPG